MTFNDNADVSGNKARRRGRGAVVGGSVGGLGIVGVIIALLLGGGDLGSLLGGGLGGDTGGGTAQEETIDGCETGSDANNNDDCRLAAATLALDGYWEGQVDGYRAPQFYIVDGSTSTQCGTASNAVGPFYCPPEEAVYIDPDFWSLLGQQFGSEIGPLAQLYVLAHEYGHHIQQITGIMDANPDNGTGADSNSVRTELQADCFAGAWVAAMSEETDASGTSYLQPATEEQLEDALDAAATVGDDNIQSQSGQVNPDSFSHGTSEQRKRWFATGYQNGVGQCDTFAVSGSEL